MPDISRINPLSLRPGQVGNEAAFRKHVVQSISMCVRVGDNAEASLGFIQDFKWSIERAVSEVYQIEAIPDGTIMSGVAMTNPGLADTTYWPGEVIEQIPGKQGAAKLTLNRCTLYGSNLMSALMYLQGAGTEEDGAAGVEKSSLGEGEISDEAYEYFTQYVSLIQQIRPVYIKQLFFNPITGKASHGRIFEECWITDMSEALPSADQNKAVVEEMSLSATRIRPIKVS